MAIRTYKVTLDSKNTIAPEPVYLRQGDKTGAVVIDATLVDNGSPVSLSGLTPMFKANTADGQAVIADSTGFTVTDSVNGKFTYQVPNALSAIPGKITTAYFSLSDADGSESTFDVAFIIKAATDMSKTQAEDYITIIDGTLRSLEEKINDFNTPETFVNLDAIKAKYPSGKNGVMVAADNGHKYIWANGTWTDAGVYQAVALAENDRKRLDNAIAGNSVIADPASAPYDDLNTLPVNQVTTYSVDITSIKHAPQNLVTNYGATITTYSYSSNANSGAIQVLVTSAGQQAWRVCWGGQASWIDWQTQTLSVQQIFDGANCNAPYNDLNTLPVNSRVLYGSGINHLANIPSELAENKSEGMQVITEGFNGNHAGSLQTIYLSDTKIMYQRMVWEHDGNWHQWHSYADGEAYLPGKIISANTGAPYDDLNTFPMNQTITIATTKETITQIKNLPPLNGADGLTVRSFNWGTSNNGGMQIAIDNNNVMYHRIAWGGENNWGAWKTDRIDDTNQSDNISILPSLALFQRVAVVGDSFASGELAFDGNFIDHYPISWLQIMARKNGFVGANFSAGGMTTRTFLVNEKCLPALQNAEQQDLYILALGINDEALGIDYLGNPADMELGTDTFYGNYGKIIKAIKAKAPQAKMVISTIAQDDSIADVYNDAIQQIAGHFSIPPIVQNDDPLFKSSFYKDHKQGGHPTGPVYAAMAMAFERLIGQSMIDHLDYWMTYYKDEPWN